MNPAKTLSKADLEKNGVNNVAAIKTLVANGKPPMPPFKDVLDDAAIADVAAFVLQQSKKGW
jgi:cytochrome c6